MDPKIISGVEKTHYTILYKCCYITYIDGDVPALRLEVMLVLFRHDFGQEQG